MRSFEKYFPHLDQVNIIDRRDINLIAVVILSYYDSQRR